MPVKIRLQRHGKKGKPYFWIVAADARSKRDGKYLDKLGSYNPTVNPAQIEIDVDGAVKWLQNGAQPTDTARAILSYKGVLLKHHLAGGVSKGALTEEQAEAKFNAWLEEKAKAVDNKRSKLSTAKEKSKAEALAAEKAVNEKRAADAIAAEAPAEEVVAEEEVTEVAVEETEATTEAPTEEAVKEETPEAVVEEVAVEATETPEAVVEEVVVEETKATSEVPAEEVAAEESPAAEAKKEAKKEEE